MKNNIAGNEIFPGINVPEIVIPDKITDRIGTILDKQKEFKQMGYLEVINHLVPDKLFYIAYLNYIIKGKKKIFKGKVTLANADEAARFLERVARGDIAREYAIMQQGYPDHLIFIHEDGAMLLYQALPGHFTGSVRDSTFLFPLME